MPSSSDLPSVRIHRGPKSDFENTNVRTVTPEEESAMNKRIWVGFVTVFVATQIIEGIVNFYLLGTMTSQYAHLWRPIAEVKLWMLPVTGAFFSFFFVFIFSRGYEHKGVLEGARFGLYTALMVVLPHAYNSYATLQIPYSIALQWFLYGTAEYVLAGLLLSLAFQMSDESTSPA
jgi:hypothetical protein